MRYIRQNAIALVALFFALTGSAVAARHYLITSVSQIKPSVVKQLRGNAGPAGAAGMAGRDGAQGNIGREGPQGPTGLQGATTAAIAAKISATAPFTLEGAEKLLALAPGTWNQAAGEAEQFVGTVTAEVPSEAQCPGETGPNEGTIVFSIDGGFQSGSATVQTKPTARRVVVPLDFHGLGYAAVGSSLTHSISAVAYGATCPKGVTIKVLSVDVDVLSVG